MDEHRHDHDHHDGHDHHEGHDHHADHGHSHEHPAVHNHNYARNRRALLIAVVITGVIMVLEFVGGYLSNSLALMSDAGHMLTDIMALVLSLFALQLATRAPSSTRTYGLYRMEILAALINGTALILLSVYIIYEAYLRFSSPEPINSGVMLWIAAVGLVANGVAAWAMKRSSEDNLNIRGAYLHILGDALSSVGVIVAALLIKVFGWVAADPVISIAISFVILRGAFALVKESANILLDAVPKEVDAGEVQKSLKAISGVKDLHHLHLRTIASGVYAFSAHVLIDDILMSSTGQIVQDINRVLAEKYHISHTTIQLECENCADGMVCNVGQMCVAVNRAHAHHHH
ncbi:MAG TPA: cation diffusion facilitator family transporter [Thermodesulfobacteriota bacterium]|nr:cation diffusion facilitator family transporter [Thermodesulfobacteriota bacterium]